MAAVAPDPQKMPPSSVHQANVGIPGGFNNRQPHNLPRLPQPFDINNPSYPGKAPANGVSLTPNSMSAGGPPPMPPVSSTSLKVNSANQVVSSPATYPTTTQVKVTGSGHLITGAGSGGLQSSTFSSQLNKNSTSSTNQQKPFQSSSLSSSTISLPTVNLNPANIISTNLPSTGITGMASSAPGSTISRQGVIAPPGSKVSTPSGLMTTSTLGGPRMITMPVSSTGQLGPPSGAASLMSTEPSKTEGSLTQNALLKQLLSSSSAPPKSETFPVKSGEEASKEVPMKPTLSNLASQLPKVSSEVSKAMSSTESPSTTLGGTPQFSTSTTTNIPQPQMKPGMPSSMPMSSVSNQGLAQTTTSKLGSNMIQKPDAPEGLAGMIAENTHKIPLAKLPNQPVPPTSLTGVIQVQPNSVSSAGLPPQQNPGPGILQQQRPGMPQHQNTSMPTSGQQGPGGVMRQMPGGIQNLLQSQVPIPPGELGNKVVVSSQQQLLQQQQQLAKTGPQLQQSPQQQHGGFQPQHPQQHQFRMQMQGAGGPPTTADQMRMQHQMQMQQQIRMQQQQQQQQNGGKPGVVVGGSYEPPQQIVGRVPHSGITLF